MAGASEATAQGGEGMRVWLLASASLLAACSPPTPKTESQPAAAAASNAPTATAVAPAPVEPRLKVDSARAMQYLREIVALGARAPGSPGMKKQQAYLRAKLKSDGLEEDVFTAQTPVGAVEMRNLIAKFPGTTDQAIVIASHYDTNYGLKNYVGANDGGSSTALLLEIANQLRGKKRTGPAVWLVWFDGEEAFQTWSDTDSTYGSRHLAAKWHQDGTAKRIKAFLLLDMIGDRDLSIDKDLNSTPWLVDLVAKAADNLSLRSYFFNRETLIEDDHQPFVKIGVPVIDIIDLDYGYNNVFHHTSEDTLDKVSPKSLQIVGDVTLEAIRLLSTP
jgi:glutaminyl-peptide cyclotransferase